MTSARSPRGSVTLWLLSCCILVLALGGLSVDVWRAFSARRSLASAADAAALAGASAIDEDRYRADANVVLVRDVAAARARASLLDQLDTAAMRSAVVFVDDDTVTVTVEGHVAFSLLRLVGQGGFPVAITSTATPRRST